MMVEIRKDNANINTETHSRCKQHNVLLQVIRFTQCRTIGNYSVEEVDYRPSGDCWGRL